MCGTRLNGNLHSWNVTRAPVFVVKLVECVDYAEYLLQPHIRCKYILPLSFPLCSIMEWLEHYMELSKKEVYYKSPIFFPCRTYVSHLQWKPPFGTETTKRSLNNSSHLTKKWILCFMFWWDKCVQRLSQKGESGTTSCQESGRYVFCCLIRKVDETTKQKERQHQKGRHGMACPFCLTFFVNGKSFLLCTLIHPKDTYKNWQKKMNVMKFSVSSSVSIQLWKCNIIHFYFHVYTIFHTHAGST